MSTGKHVGNQSLRSVAAAVAKRRNALRITQEEAAERCGLDRSYYGRIEAGRQNITVMTLMMLGTGLDVTPALLVSQPTGRQSYAEPKFSQPQVDDFFGIRGKTLERCLQCRDTLVQSDPARVAAIEEHQRLTITDGEVFYRGKPASWTRLRTYGEALGCRLRKILRKAHLSIPHFAA